MQIYLIDLCNTGTFRNEDLKKWVNLWIFILRFDEEIDSSGVVYLNNERMWPNDNELGAM